MSEHYEKHAEQVAAAFFDLLDSDVSSRISDEHRQELAMLVEAQLGLGRLADAERLVSESSRGADEIYREQRQALLRRGHLLTTLTENDLATRLINLGRVLEMNVIAEGVETQEQAQKLRDLNCGMAQGFWFSKPLPSDSAHALLQRELDVARSSIRNLTRH